MSNQHCECQAYQLLRKDFARVSLERTKLAEENERLKGQVDKLLDHCPDPECEVCSVIVCPHDFPLHFHHDGCGACAEHEQQAERQEGDDA